MTTSRKKPTKSETERRELHAALAWPSVETPAPLTDAECLALVAEAPGGKVRAWTYNSARGDVALGAFDGNNHVSEGSFTERNFSSRGRGGPWFSSKADACLALRAAVTLEAARRLVTIDARIASFLRAELPADAPESEPVSHGNIR